MVAPDRVNQLTELIEYQTLFIEKTNNTHDKIISDLENYLEDLKKELYDLGYTLNKERYLTDKELKSESWFLGDGITCVEWSAKGALELLDFPLANDVFKSKDASSVLVLSSGMITVRPIIGINTDKRSQIAYCLRTNKFYWVNK